MQANAMLDLAQRLFALEAEQCEAGTSLSDIAESVFEKIRTHLSKRIGQEGFRTLQARSLALTRKSFPLLHTVRIEENGSLAGLRGGTESFEAAAALLACLLGLLGTFIGEDLTLRMLRAIWPKLDVDGMPTRKVKDYERAK